MLNGRLIMTNSWNLQLLSIVCLVVFVVVVLKKKSFLLQSFRNFITDHFVSHVNLWTKTNRIGSHNDSC